MLCPPDRQETGRGGVTERAKRDVAGRLRIADDERELLIGRVVLFPRVVVVRIPAPDELERDVVLEPCGVGAGDPRFLEGGVRDVGPCLDFGFLGGLRQRLAVGHPMRS